MTELKDAIKQGLINCIEARNILINSLKYAPDDSNLLAAVRLTTALSSLTSLKSRCCLFVADHAYNYSEDKVQMLPGDLLEELSQIKRMPNLEVNPTDQIKPRWCILS